MGTESCNQDGPNLRARAILSPIIWAMVMVAVMPAVGTMDRARTPRFGRVPLGNRDGLRGVVMPKTTTDGHALNAIVNSCFTLKLALLATEIKNENPYGFPMWMPRDPHWFFIVTTRAKEVKIVSSFFSAYPHG